MLVDTQGLLLRVRVLAANLTDREGGKLLLEGIGSVFTRLGHLFVDGGYQGKWVQWVKETLGWTVEVVQRADANFRGIYWPDGVPMPPELAAELRKKTRGYRSFVVIPRRWVVERTLAWLSFYRRLNRDYEFLPETTETFVYTAMIRLMVRRLAC